jgi:nitroreductase
MSSEKEKDYFFNLLKTRRACRLFDPRPVPREILDRIVYAAHRAPTGGNIPYRFVILVDDSTQLKLLKMVSPGLLGDPTALLVICTNLKIAETGGSICDVASHIDAGAAAENAVTAAYAMGLGASFIKSYSEVAVRRILDIPDYCRTEIVVSLGFPSKDEPPPIRKGKPGKITYVNFFGKEMGELER